MWDAYNTKKKETIVKQDQPSPNPFFNVRTHNKIGKTTLHAVLFYDIFLKKKFNIYVSPTFSLIFKKDF